MKYKNAVIHSLLVGAIAAFAILISGWLEIKAWVVFFGWANYFLHACNMKKSFKMLWAFLIGIFIALAGTYAMSYLGESAAPESRLYISAAVVFCIAFILIFLEIIENWGEFVPATFLGTVLFFASGVTFTTILPELIVPLLIGNLAGYFTIYSRTKLASYLENKQMSK